MSNIDCVAENFILFVKTEICCGKSSCLVTLVHEMTLMHCWLFYDFPGWQSVVWRIWLLQFDYNFIASPTEKANSLFLKLWTFESNSIWNFVWILTILSCQAFAIGQENSCCKCIWNFELTKLQLHKNQTCCQASFNWQL